MSFLSQRNYQETAMEPQEMEPCTALSLSGESITLGHIHSIADILLSIKEKKAIVLDFAGSDFEPEALIALFKLLENELYPPGMTLELSNSAIYNLNKEIQQKLSKSLRAAITKSRKPINLCFSYLILNCLCDDFYDLLRYNQCIESLRLTTSKSDKKDYDFVPWRLDRAKIASALRPNIHFLNIEIDKEYYSTEETREAAPGPFLPRFFSEEIKHEINPSALISRNLKFKSARRRVLDDLFVFQTSWPTELSILIGEYIDLPASQDEQDEMARTAIAEVKSYQALKQNGFDTFFLIYLSYRESCRDAFEKDPDCVAVLREHLSPFLDAFHIICSKFDVVRKIVVSDTLFFVRLAHITRAELERLCHMGPDSIDLLAPACTDYKETRALNYSIAPHSDFKEILSLPPGSVIRLNRVDNLFCGDDLLGLLCNVIEDKTCPENLTMVIEKYGHYGNLRHALAKLIRTGSYPKGTSFIFDSSDGRTIYDYKELFKALLEKSDKEKPELHLMVPILDDATDDRAIRHRKRIRDIVVHSTFLKTLTFYPFHVKPIPNNDPLSHENILNALKINDQLTKFEIGGDIRQTIDYRFWGLRNQQFISEQCGTSFYRLQMIFAKEAFVCPKQAMPLFFIATERYAYDLTIVFNGPFLDFFKQHFLQLIEGLIINLNKDHNNALSYHDFVKIISRIVIAAKITTEDIRKNTYIARPLTADMGLAAFLIQCVQKRPARTVGTSSIPVLLEIKQESGQPHMHFKNDLFVTSTLQYNEAHELMPYVEQDKRGEFEQQIKELFSSGRLTLRAALQLTFVLKETEQDLEIASLNEELKYYEARKGPFRKFFNTRTTTVRDLQHLAEEALKIGNKKVSALQIELCLMARDRRNSHFNFRSGIINQSVAFFKTGDPANCRKSSCKNKGPESFNLTERLIGSLSKTYRNLM